MADGDRSTVRIDVRGVVGKPEIARHGERLRGKRLVKLDHVHLRELQPRLLQDFARGRRRTHAHDARRDAVPTASRLEPHNRFTVAPGTVSGNPARSNAMRATLRLSSPAWLTHP